HDDAAPDLLSPPCPPRRSSDLAMPHFDPTGGAHRHLVLLQPDTRLEEIYGAGEIRVNSSHHQAARQPGAGLRISARSPDGVVEADRKSTRLNSSHQLLSYAVLC